MPILKGLSAKYKFFFFSSEYYGGKLEKPHLHVRHGGNEAKFWITDSTVAENFGFSTKEVREIQEIISTNRDIIQNTWNDYFNRP
jgi:hypothetical protein